jgi:cell division protein FtsN
MARDYKNRRRPKRKASGSGPTGSFLGGLSVGLAVAFLVHLYHEGQDEGGGAERPRQVKQSAVTEPEVVPDEEPPFDFYEILPEYEVVVPEPIDPPSPGGGQQTAASGAAYFIQAGSFRRFEDADRRKASLALLGIPSSIRKVDVNSRATHRVQIGPVSDTRELQRLQRLLSQNSIEYLTLRAKEPAT